MDPRIVIRDLWVRQNGDDGTFGDGDGDGDDGFDGGWWWTPTGLAVRYTVVIVVFALLLLYFVGGYWHARRRTRKGLPLRAYHRWMVTRRPAYLQPPSGYAASPAYTYYYGPPGTAAGGPGVANGPQPEQYAMQGFYHPPPPAYNGAEAAPPVYQPPPSLPEGASKILADQAYNTPAPAQGSSSLAAPEATAHGARQA